MTMMNSIRRKLFGFATFGHELIEGVQHFGAVLSGPLTVPQRRVLDDVLTFLSQALTASWANDDKTRAQHVKHEIDKAVVAIERQLAVANVDTPTQRKLDAAEEKLASKLRARGWVQGVIDPNDFADFERQLVAAFGRDCPIRILAIPAPCKAASDEG